jgi:hypothetical protein
MYHLHFEGPSPVSQTVSKVTKLFRCIVFLWLLGANIYLELPCTVKIRNKVG